MEKQCWCCLYYTVKGLSDLAKFIDWLTAGSSVYAPSVGVSTCILSVAPKASALRCVTNHFDRTNSYR